MPRRTPEDDTEPFEYRPGLGFQYFRGMNRSADPAAIPPNQFHLLANVRLTPAGMTDRPGLVPHHDTEESGCITGMIEIDEQGVGFWVTPTPWEDTDSGDQDDTYLGNFNETRPVGEVFLRYNRNDSDVNSEWYDPPFTPGIGSPSPTLITGMKTCEYAPGFTWVSFFKYRKKLLQFGTRTRFKEDEADEYDTVVCLWEVKLPGENEDRAGYELYRDLWIEDTDTDPTDVVTVFKRSQDPLEGAEQVQEVMYIARADGTVWSFDGTTLQQEYDFGASYTLRLGVLNGMGVLAIGSDSANESSSGTGVARFLSAPGGSWTAVSLPETNILVTDITSWNGAIYIVAVENVDTGNNAPRIYKYEGGASLPAYIYEFPWVSGATVGDVLDAGHFVQYRNTLYVTDRIVSGFNNWEWHLRKRVADNTWTQLPTAINFHQDEDADIYWIYVTGGRCFIGAFGIEAAWISTTGPPYDARYAIGEIKNFNTTGGPTVTELYQNSNPYEKESCGRHVITHAPEDSALNEEEL